MQVVYTEQALQSQEEALDFLLEQEKPYDQILEIRDHILDRADSLAEHPEKGQQEEYWPIWVRGIGASWKAITKSSTG